MKKILLFVVALLAIVSLASCNSAKFDESKGELVIGLECDYAPYNWTETTKTDTNYPISNVANGYAEGYDVHMAKKVADALGYTLVIKKIDWDGLIPALQSGVIDAIIAGMSPTEDRKLSINFTDPYYTSTHVLMGKADSAYLNAKHFSDLSGAKVIGQKNTIFDTLALQCSTKNSEITHLTALETVPLIVTAIKSGVADLTILEEPVAVGLCAADSSLAYFELEDQFDVDESDIVVSIGIRKVDTTLCEKINAALANISSEERTQLMNAAVQANAE